MPDDNRLDLSVDVDKIGDDLLQDVKAATEQVKKRRDSDKAKDAESAVKAKSRQLSAVVIAAAAVVLVVIAYFVIFAKPEAPAASTPTGPYSQTHTPAIKPPGATTAIPGATTPATRPMPPAGRSSQAADRPSDDYEQPSDKPGM